MNELKIHDIKALSEIPDYSLYIFTLLIIISIVIILSVCFFIYKFFKNKNSDPKKSFEILKNIDFNNAKQSAYTITKHSRILVSNPREEKLLEELIEDLVQYKYKKDVQAMNNQTKQKFKIFMESLDVK